ncbi:MAG TPA: polysaccharide biosynthesis/export family protein [Stellaceae bacterium]|nr:polysaccharide biosynthesis/export family protein [Stellaceae bacterium]
MPNAAIKISRLAAILVLFCLAGCHQTWVEPKYQQADRFATWNDDPPPYRIQAGDDLSVIMPYNAELNYEGPVGPDGRFTMPLVGSIKAAMLTVPEVEHNIDVALTKNGVTQDSHPSVTIRHYAGQVYVGGQVRLPGAVALQSNMDALQAVTVAGGLLDTARTGEVVLIRHSPDGKPMLRTINLDALTHKGDPKQEVLLQPQDIVFVPKSSISEVDQWVDQFITQTLPFSRSAGYSYNMGTTNTP